MSSEEWKEKLEEQLSQIRQQGAELEAALQKQKERKEFAKMVAEERARQDAKKRTFANAQNAEEAEGTLPTLEELANGKQLPSKEQLDTGEVVMGTPRGWKTKREILEDGTLIASIRTKEDKELVEKCYREYSALRKYGEQLRFYFKRFQTSFAMLAILLNKWDSYEQRAAEYTQEYNSLGTRTIELNVTETKATQIPNEILQGALTKYVEKLNSRGSFDGATLYFDEATTSFKVKVDGKGGLYSQIKQEAQAAKDDLRDFKAFTDVVEEFIKNSTLFYMPISIQMSIENAEEERYTRYLVKNLSFFRSELNVRMENGEAITPEDEKRAVIPDFYEVTPTKEVYKSCKKYIKELMADGK